MKQYRDVGGHGGLGDRRYERYCAAFDWAEHSMREEYFLEAIAILDSLIWDRLSSRLGHLKGEPIDATKTSGALCRELIGNSGNGGCEKDRAFRDAIDQIKKWVVRRNDAVHATAKVFREGASEEDFSAILKSHGQTAESGKVCLQKFDLLDTRSRAEAGKRPASYPNAFFPEQREGGSRASIWKRGLGRQRSRSA